MKKRDSEAFSAPKKRKEHAHAAPPRRRVPTLLGRLRRLVGGKPKTEINGDGDASLDALEKRLGYHFEKRSLLVEALTHPSFVQQKNRGTPHNQRLEFLGDAVLGLVLAEHLFHDLPDEREGELARARSALGKGELLAELARRLGLPECLRLGKGDEASGGRGWQSSQEDVFEAMIGAVYLDGGYAAARDAVLRWFGDLEKLRAELLSGDNPKGRLQEWLAQRGHARALSYRIAQTAGPEHAKIFHIELMVHGEVMGIGEGRSKKEAEEQAASQALEKLLTKTGS